MTGNWHRVVRLAKNKNGRDFVCGDIHGCFSDLETELKRIGFDKTADRLFCVGDLIDRGPRSDLSIFYANQSWFFSCLGNHEHLFYMANTYNEEQDSHRYDHVYNGGSWAYNKLSDEKRTALLDAVERLPLIIKVGKTIIAHAALPDVESLEDIERNTDKYLHTILWHRGEYPDLLIPGITRVYVGHNIVKEPCQYERIINIDTGAFLKYRKKEGKLTVLEI
jgi:serine/threonine protein phosphatase 1